MMTLILLVGFILHTSVSEAADLKGSISICPQVLCTADCINGYIYNANGCQTCICKECPQYRCMVPVCKYGIKKDKNGCPTCSCNDPPCPQYRCMVPVCKYGIKMDKNGCPTCSCNGPPCKAVSCKMYCTYGWAVNKFGCEICECKVCPKLPCAGLIKCQYGQVKDENGCPTCQCRQCPEGVLYTPCFQDPCNSATCNGYPEAICRSNYCGGCNAVFYDYAGNEVTCSKISLSAS